jgi:hypothetical protein
VDREDSTYVKRSGIRKCFHVGGNLSLRNHMQKHYDIVKMRCAAQNIPVNHYAIPWSVWKVMQEVKEGKKNTSGKGYISL